MSFQLFLGSERWGTTMAAQLNSNFELARQLNIVEVDMTSDDDQTIGGEITDTQDNRHDVYLITPPAAAVGTIRLPALGSTETGRVRTLILDDAQGFTAATPRGFLIEQQSGDQWPTGGAFSGGTLLPGKTIMSPYESITILMSADEIVTLDRRRLGTQGKEFSAAGTIPFGMDLVYADTSGGAFTLDLQTANLHFGFPFRVVNLGSNTLTVDASGSELINGAGTIGLAQWESKLFIPRNVIGEEWIAA